VLIEHLQKGTCRIEVIAVGHQQAAARGLGRARPCFRSARAPVLDQHLYSDTIDELTLDRPLRFNNIMIFSCYVDTNSCGQMTRRERSGEQVV
jgi:hypothetical protein